MMASSVLVPESTRDRLTTYQQSLETSPALAGAHLANELARQPSPTRSQDQFLSCLLNTKIPQIFAESAVAGDGSDWNLTELGLLGDVSIAVPVTVFDNGRHSSPSLHTPPIPGTLVFTPGALLRNGRGFPPADIAETTRPDGSLDPEGYYALYERRLLPVFRYIDESASSLDQQALVTVPGLGCGQFAGRFQGLEQALTRFLHTHGQTFPSIRAVYYDPFNEGSNVRTEIHHISFMVRPLLMGNEKKPQLCHPTTYQDPGDDFSRCHLFSIVAWDHVSWPGNDFFVGSRCTDDGVKAAATDSMRALTRIPGTYDPKTTAYLPPHPYRTWEEVVRQNHLRL